MAFYKIFNNTRYMQYVAVLSATLSATCSSVYMAWSSPSLPKLLSSNSPIGITLSQTEASWVASSLFLGTVPGGIVAAFLLSRLGPKTTLFISTVLLCVPWLAIILAKSAITLCVARFIAGIFFTVSQATIPIYNGEVSEKDIRGKLGATFSMLVSIGSLFVFSIGPFVSYTTLAISCSVLPLLFSIIYGFMPESPYYLAKTNRKEKASLALNRLSAYNTDLKWNQTRLAEIYMTIELDMQNQSTLWELFSKKQYRKPLIIMTVIKLLHQFSGLNAIAAYMQTIIEVSGSSVSSEMTSIFFGAIQIPAVLMAATLVDKIGRRPLLIVSSVGCAVALALEGVYFYFYDNGKYPDLIATLSWLPTTGLLLFTVMNPLGINTIPIVLLGEIFPINAKGHAVSLFSHRLSART